MIQVTRPSGMAESFHFRCVMVVQTEPCLNPSLLKVISDARQGLEMVQIGTEGK